MDKVVLVEMVVGLVVLISVLVLFLLYRSKAKRKRAEVLQQQQKKDVCPYTLEELVGVIRNKKSSQNDLASATEDIVRYYGKIAPKNGTEVSEEFYTYAKALSQLCRHPHVSKPILLRFEKELRTLNPHYAKELENILMKAIKSR